MSAIDAGPWHAGERAAQTLAFGRPNPGGGAIRSFMSDQHRLFFAELPFAIAATTDATGAPAATLLSGPPGFIASPNPWTLAVLGQAADPTGARLRVGAPVGLLGLQPQTRRRNRANGRILFEGQAGFVLAVEQSFGNCPQYIHPRDLALDPAAATDLEVLNRFDAAARGQVASADTFFVGTASGPGVAGGGVDVSHRGGPAGFVRIEGDVLTIPDYRGNRYFNTLGNLMLEPRAALLFVDFAAGRLLQLQGTAEVVWNCDDLPSAERIWRFHVERGWRRAAGLRQVAVQAPSTESAAPVAPAPASETR